MKTLFRAFIFPPKHQPIGIHLGHGRVGKYTCSELSTMPPVGKNRLPQKFN
jgi:hypothetical protein